MLLRNAGIHLGSGSTARGGGNGHPSSQKAMPVARAAGLRWSDFELGGDRPTARKSRCRKNESGSV
jgi:hypothetical protein